jgi:hypothetical protein
MKGQMMYRTQRRTKDQRPKQKNDTHKDPRAFTGPRTIKDGSYKIHHLTEKVVAGFGSY